MLLTPVARLTRARVEEHSNKPELSVTAPAVKKKAKTSLGSRKIGLLAEGRVGDFLLSLSERSCARH